MANPDVPAPQAALDQILCAEFNLTGSTCANETLLPLTIGYFRTPTVRDLGQSNPYLHNGSMNKIPDVINFYLTTSALARAKTLRAGSPEVSDIEIDQTDVTPLAAFLRALNEDYDLASFPTAILFHHVGAGRNRSAVDHQGRSGYVKGRGQEKSDARDFFRACQGGGSAGDWRAPPGPPWSTPPVTSQCRLVPVRSHWRSYRSRPVPMPSSVSVR